MDIENKMLPIELRFQFDDVAFTVDRKEFNPNEDYWHIGNRNNFNFDFKDEVSSRFIYEIKRVAKSLASSQNMNSTNTSYRQLRRIIKDAIITKNERLEILDARDLSTWIMQSKNANYIAQLRIFTSAAKILKAGLLTDEAQEFLDNLTLTHTRTTQYEAVRTWNPVSGPYRPTEDLALKTAIDSAFEEGEVSLRQYFVARMFRGFGMRPEQFVQMKVEDIRQDENGMRIRIPKIKQRGVGKRGAFLPWKAVSVGLANVINAYIKQNIEPLIADKSLLRHSPLILKIDKQKFTPDPSLQAHSNMQLSLNIFNRTFKKLAVRSPLTGELINVNPRRERHTFATQLAMNGASAQEIAINLGHSSVQSCEAYVDASTEHYQRLEALVGEAFIPIADRFLGKVIKSEDKAKDLNFALYNNDFESVGSCSSQGCNALESGVAPIACYTCKKFNAWADGPHEGILDMLLKEQEFLNEDGYAKVAETKTETIVAINDLLEVIRLQGVK